MQFNKIKLKDIADINMGQSPSGSSYNNNGRGIPFLQGNKTFGFLYPTIDTWTTEPKKFGKKNSVLMSVRAPVGDLNIANKDICIGRGLCSIEMKNGNNQFLYYLMKNSIKKIKMKSTGTVFESINRKELENIEILDFDKSQQKKISKILFDIDKKIELNIQTNDNLYKILEQYIKEHYYNNEFVRNGNVNDIGKIQGGYAFKSKDLLNETTNNKVLKIKNISASGVDIDNTQCVYDEVADKVDKKFLLLRGNVIIAMTGAELGKTGYLYGQDYRYFLNQRVGVIRGNDKYSELYLNCLFLLKDMQNTLNSKGYGSAQPNISTSDIENIEIPIPKEDELETFYEKCNPIYSKMILNSEQNQSLTQLRDSLLPKLMNGEIDLDKIEI